MTQIHEPTGHPLVVQPRPTSWFKPDPKNARKHTRKQINKLARVIEKGRFTQPILHDETGLILAGHARLEAAKQLGMTEVPAIELRGLTEIEKTSLALSDNKLSDESSFDEDTLKLLLSGLAQDVSFDFELTGFDEGEIDFRVDGSPGPKAGDVADQASLIQYGELPVTVAGDLWLLDRHRLVCGSALNDGSYVRVLDGKLAQMTFSDPPYNVPVNGHVSGKGKHKHREFVEASGEMTRPEFCTFLRNFAELMGTNSADGSIHYVCMDWRSVDTLLKATEGIFSELKNICVWVKRSGGMGSLYRSQHELVAVFKKGKAPHRNNIELGKNGRFRTNVWDYPGANSFGPTRDADLAAHPTVKPVALVADAIRDCSNRGDVIGDPFCGSGTTILAAERTGRVAVGCCQTNVADATGGC